MNLYLVTHVAVFNETKSRTSTHMVTCQDEDTARDIVAEVIRDEGFPVGEIVVTDISQDALDFVMLHRTAGSC